MKCLILIPLFIFLLSGCAETQKFAPRPAAKRLDFVEKKELSQVGISIKVTTDDLAKIINSYLAGTLYQGKTSIDGLNVSVKKLSKITLSARDGFVFADLACELVFSYFIFNLKFPVDFSFKTKLAITNEWKIAAETEFQSVYKDLAEEIKIGTLLFNPRNFAENALKPMQTQISEMINSELNKYLALQTRISEVWETLHTPFLISEKGSPLWLKIKPVSIISSPVSANNNLIELTASVSCWTEIVSGAKPLSEKSSPLPALLKSGAISNKFNITIKADIFYKNLSEIISAQIKGKSFIKKGKKIKIEGFEIYGNGSDVVITAILSGDVNGNIYLNGTPKFNTKNSLLYFENIDFDIETKDFLVATAIWFMHDSFKEDIAKVLKIDLKKTLSDIRETAQNSLSKKELVPHIFFSGNISSIVVRDLVVHDDKITVYTAALGDSTIVIE